VIILRGEAPDALDEELVHGAHREASSSWHTAAALNLAGGSRSARRAATRAPVGRRRARGGRTRSDAVGRGASEVVEVGAPNASRDRAGRTGVTRGSRGLVVYLRTLKVPSYRGYESTFVPSYELSRALPSKVLSYFRTLYFRTLYFRTFVRKYFRTCNKIYTRTCTVHVYTYGSEYVYTRMC
jgi:hypothetical protein